MSGVVAERLRLRLFLEGVECPMVAVSVQSAPNSPSVATIQVPPLAEGTKLLPRTLVHVFFYDGTSDPGNYVLHNVKARPGGDSPELQMDMAAAGYRLLFCGELAGFQWSKNPVQRSLSLQCVDMSCYWDTAYQWVNTDIFGPGYKARFSNGGTDVFTDFMSSPGEVVTATVTDGIRNGTLQYPKLRGLLGGIVKVLERIGGAYFTDDRKSFKGANVFFSLAELRLHITQMIGAYEKDPTAQRLLGGSWDGFFGRTISGLGEQVSIRNVINALMPVVFHETYAQPSPYYTAGSYGTISGYKRTTYGDDPGFSGFAGEAERMGDGVRSILADLTTATGLLVDKPLAQRISMLASQCKNQAASMTNSSYKTGKAKFSSASVSLGMAAATAFSYTGNSSNTRIIGLLQKALTELASIKNLPVTLGSKATSEPARVWNQIFRPDVWFSAPPRCNVIFPDQVMNFDYSRAFFQEPTRLLLKTNEEWAGEDELFDKLYFAPYAEGIKTQKAQLMSMLQGDIMEHELYTGILPVFEKMGEYNIFAAKAGMVNGAGAKVGMSQRTTNFLFFKHRFENRQAQVTMKFHPYIACGFPCLVIDKWLDVERLEKHRQLMANLGKIPPEVSSYFGSHFLGNAVQVVTSADQSGTSNSTTITLNYARQLDEKVEFLGSVAPQQRMWVRQDSSSERTTDVAAVSPPRTGSLGPASGEITSVVDVTDQFVQGDPKIPSKSLPMYMSRRAGASNMPYVLVGTTLLASQYDPAVAKLFDNPNQPVLFRAYRVTEQVPKYRSQTVDMPAEELIRPGWYGECWHPGKIGEVYQTFFGTGAMTDPVTLVEPQMQQQFAGMGIAGSNTPFVLPDRPQKLDSGVMVNRVSIKEAADFLLQAYSFVKQNGYNVSDFIHAYTWRPIMNMAQMFGTSNLEFDVNGSIMTPKDGAREGFHSRAFGPYSDVFTLVPPEVQSVIGIKRGDKSNLLASLGDTRKAKRDAVNAYISALQYSSAILG